jgi:hypothetical protein
MMASDYNDFAEPQKAAVETTMQHVFSPFFPEFDLFYSTSPQEYSCSC